MAGSIHYPDVASRRQPIQGRHAVREAVSARAVVPRRMAKGAVVLGTILGIGAGVGVTIIALAHAGAPRPRFP